MQDNPGMRAPPAVSPDTQEACVGKPRGKGGNRRWVRIVNPVVNRPQILRRKDAERLVDQKRTVCVSVDQLRLDLSGIFRLGAARW
jgi:hypothetical protein